MPFTRAGSGWALGSHSAPAEPFRNPLVPVIHLGKSALSVPLPLSTNIFPAELRHADTTLPFFTLPSLLLFHYFSLSLFIPVLYRCSLLPNIPDIAANLYKQRVITGARLFHSPPRFPFAAALPPPPHAARRTGSNVETIVAHACYARISWNLIQPIKFRARFSES